MILRTCKIDYPSNWEDQPFSFATLPILMENWGLGNFWIFSFSCAGESNAILFLATSSLTKSLLALDSSSFPDNWLVDWEAVFNPHPPPSHSQSHPRQVNLLRLFNNSRIIISDNDLFTYTVTHKLIYLKDKNFKSKWTNFNQFMIKGPSFIVVGTLLKPKNMKENKMEV